MGRKKARYENAGNIKSVYTVNFREPEEIIQIIQQFKGIKSLEDNLAFLYIELQNKIAKFYSQQLRWAGYYNK